jgi:peptidoglycan/xylan/chitin deacetylase (PgdA/CDA1 family)
VIVSRSLILPGRSFYTLERAQEYFDAVFGEHRYRTQAVVALRFDDSHENDYLVVLPELRSRGLIASFATVPGILDRTTEGLVRLTEEQVKEIRLEGHEIMNHSWSHGDPKSKEEMLEDIRRAQQFFADESIWCEGFVQPGSWTREEFDGDGFLDEMFRANFASAFAYVRDHVVPGDVLPLPAQRRYGSFVHTRGDLKGLDVAIAFVDDLITRRGLGHLLLHSEQFEVNSGRGDGLTVAEFRRALDHVELRRDQGRIDVMTMTGSVWARSGVPNNELLDGSFELSSTGDLAGWEAAGNPAIVTTSEAQHGSRVAEVDRTNRIRKRLPAHAYRTLELRGHVRAASVDTTARVEIVNTASRRVVRGTVAREIPVTSDTWTEFRITFGPLGPDVLVLRLTLQATGADRVWFDNLECVRI